MINLFFWIHQSLCEKRTIFLIVIFCSGNYCNCPRRVTFLQMDSKWFARSQHVGGNTNLFSTLFPHMKRPESTWKRLMPNLPSLCRAKSLQEKTSRCSLLITLLSNPPAPWHSVKHLFLLRWRCSHIDDASRLVSITGLWLPTGDRSSCNLQTSTPNLWSCSGTCPLATALSQPQQWPAILCCFWLSRWNSNRAADTGTLNKLRKSTTACPNRLSWCL